MKKKGRNVQVGLMGSFLKELADQTAHIDSPPGADQPPRLAHALLMEAAAARVSDVHIEPGKASALIRFRVDGVISDVATVTLAQARMIINQIKVLANLDPIVTFTPRDAHASYPVGTGKLDLRLALAPSYAGETLTLRLLDPLRLERSISDLGFALGELELLESWITTGAGMFLAAGPTGCGKTTTIYSLLHELKKSDHAIVSLEDPVEYQLDGVVQVQLDQPHHLSYGEGIRSMLRLDPDYVMIGEIRDAASARSAVDAAISGRVLLSTLHSRDAVGALTALRNWGLQDREIAEVLSVVVGQRLVRRLCPHCSRHRAVSPKERQWFTAVGLAVPAQVSDAAGCDRCAHIGYKGRSGVFELWHLTEPDYEAILKHTDEHAVRRSLAERKRRSILVDGLGKVADGVTSVAELRRAVSGAFPSHQL